MVSKPCSWQLPPLAWSELLHQLTPLTPLAYGRHKGKITKWWHASIFYTGSKERSRQILISQVKCHHYFCGYASFSRELYWGVCLRHTQETQFSYNTKVTGKGRKLMLSGSGCDDACPSLQALGEWEVELCLPSYAQPDTLLGGWSFKRRA